MSITAEALTLLDIRFRQEPSMLALWVFAAIAAAAPLRDPATIAPTSQVTFTTDTTIADGNTTWEGYDVTVDGCTVTIDGAHAFHSLLLKRNSKKSSIVTHSATHTGTSGNGLILTIASDCTIEGALGTGLAGRMDFNGKGFVHDAGPGAGTRDGLGYGSGGSYGGLGGSTAWSAPPGPAYGSYLQPVDFGSGGANSGSSKTNGGSGGGALRLIVQGALTIDGTISSNGAGHVNSSYPGGGSGGSLWITTGSLAGSGLVSANGESLTSGSSGGCGGAGRIAVEYQSSTFSGTYQTVGGSVGSYFGGAGTLCVTDLQTGVNDLTVANTGAFAGETPLPGSIAITGSLTVAGGAIAAFETIDVGSDVNVLAGRITCLSTGPTPLLMTVGGSVFVDPTGSINLDGRGYLHDSGPGAGTRDGLGYGSGGSYGGLGGTTAWKAPPGPTYGSYLQPVDFGSGGASASGKTNGGNGGGALRLIVQGTLTIDGTISSNGAGSWNYSYPGGGSGGSLWITAGTLAGIGLVNANGESPSGSFGGCGGAGRIAVEYQWSTFSGTYHAVGGSLGSYFGGAGTLCVTDLQTGINDLTVANTGAFAGETPLPGSIAITGSLTVADGAIAAFETLDVGSDVNVLAGRITCLSTGPTPLLMTVGGSVFVDPAGSINLDGRGYLHDTGPGAGTRDGLGYGSGGSYGGLGGTTAWKAPPGPTYGSYLQPVDFGSGGASASGKTNGGNGGGALRLIVQGTLTIDGTISSNGAGSWNYSYPGGGSGGSLWITAGTLAGIGLVNANGESPSGSFGGCGGGGRISIFTTTSSTFSLPVSNISALGGSGKYSGSPGTIWINDAAWENYGQGLAGTYGVPALTLSADPVIGTTVTFTVGNSLGATTISVGIAGAAKTATPMKGGTLLVGDVLMMETLTIDPGGLQFDLDIDNDPSIVGTPYNLQFLEVDPGAPRKVSFTRGLEMILGY